MQIVDGYAILGEGEHKFKLPPIPDNPDEILFSRNKKTDQYWRRQDDLPNIFYDYNWGTKLWQENTVRDHRGILKSLNKADSETLIFFRDRELQRRINGIWFMNNGVPTFLTGGHYFILQWAEMADVQDLDKNPVAYGGYREFQCELAYFLELCKRDDDCVGGFILKPKKTGVTLFIELDILDEATRYRNKHFGIMSKVLRPDCVDTNFAYLLYAYERLPYIMRPRCNADTQTKIEFNPKKKRSSVGVVAKGDEIQEDLKGLNSVIFCAPTKANGFDGPKMFRAHYDEILKYEKPNNCALVAAKGSQVVKEQRQINGKIWLSSYPPEDDVLSFFDGRELWNDSLVATKDPITKRTKSELYVHYISTIGSEMGTFDRYGKSNKALTKRMADAKRRQLADNPTLLQNEIRQYSQTSEEAWQSGGSGGKVFNPIRFGARKKKLKEELIHGRNYVEGHFEWKNNIPFSEVEFVQLSEKDILNNKEDVVRIYQFDKIRESDLNRVVREGHKDRKGYWSPPVDSVFVGASDPTDYVLKSDVLAGSNNAITAMCLPSPEINQFFGGDYSDRFVARSVFRPENPEDYLDDLIKWVFFFGMPIVIEGNKKWVITKMKQLNLHNFLLMRGKDKILEPYDPNLEQSYPDTVRAGAIDVTEDLIRGANMFFKPPATEHDIDQLNKLDLLELIEGFIEFDPNNTKRFDEPMCAMYNIMARNAIMSIRSKPSKTKEKYSKETVQSILDALGSMYGAG